MRVWKYLEYGLFAIGISAIPTWMVLLNWYAVERDVHTVPDAAHSIREQYGALVFYITPAQQSWLSILLYIICSAMILGALVAFARGDIRGKHK